MALNRGDVVTAAVVLLDEVGLDGLTLRRLAAKLGVAAPTLYWHVSDKRALLDLVAEAIVGQNRPAARPVNGQPWWEWLSAAAWAHYRALSSHRDAALVVAGNRPTDGSLLVMDEVVGSLVEVGFPPAEALESILTIGHFVLGSALEYQAEAAREGGTARGAAVSARARDLEQLPHLAAAAGSRPTPNPDATFAHGLRLIISGLRTRHGELVGLPSVHA